MFSKRRSLILVDSMLSIGTRRTLDGDLSLVRLEPIVSMVK